MYYSGSLNPGILIDEKTSKIASLTDLSLGMGNYPLIRIQNFPVPKRYVQKGRKIPVAGTYQKTEEYPHWNFYEHLPLPSGIIDDEIINEKTNSIPLEEWLTLKSELKKFEGIPDEGYYPIKIDESDWKNIDLSKITWV